MLDMVGMIDDPTVPKAGKHRDLEPAQVQRSEQAVQKVLTAISHFTNPFRIPDKDKLYSLASGASMSAEIEYDVMRSDALGEKLKQDFIQDRLKTSKVSFFNFDPVTHSSK